MLLTRGTFCSIILLRILPTLILPAYRSTMLTACVFVTRDTGHHPRCFVFRKFVRKLNCSWSEVFVNRGLTVYVWHYIINLKNTMMDTQMNLYKTMEVRGGLHGCETWVMTHRNKNRLHAAKMWFFISVIGITKWNKIKKDDIKNKAHVERLNYSVNKYRQNWKKHVQHVTENRIPRQMVNYQLLERRSCGQHRKWWQDQT
jgi:hypothetical protein